MNRLILLFGLLCGGPALADAIAMRDYNLLRNGMSEAEVLYRLGPYDHRIVESDRYNYTFAKTWFYIPSQRNANKWITELRFNSAGRLIARDRYRVR